VKSTAITNLKASLSKYLRLVKAGEEILVTERGKPVAKIIPVKESKNERFVATVKQGLIKLGSGKLPDKIWRLPRPEDTQGLGVKYLLEDRQG
jgi:prevent-host-death family protein